MIKTCKFNEMPRISSRPPRSLPEEIDGSFSIDEAKVIMESCKWHN